MLDRTDRRLLRALQQNGAMTAQEMGRHLGLSTSQAGRRRQKLEQTGVLRAVSIDIAPEACGLSVQAFLTLTRSAHDPALMDDFSDCCTAPLKSFQPLMSQALQTQSCAFGAAI